MDKLISELASLRIAVATGSASEAQQHRCAELTSQLPEEAVEDAESRVEAVMPSVMGNLRGVS